MREDSTEELKRAIAALFLGEGVEKMKEEQMLTAISMKRRWFTPEMAKAVIENGKKSGLLVESGDYLSPNFDYRAMEIPFGYYPPANIAKIQGEPIKERLIREIGLSEPEIKEALSMDYNITDEMKIILWAAKKGREYRKFLDIVEKGLLGSI